MSKEYVIVPKEDYVDTCNAIREKGSTTELLKSGEMAQAVRGISSPKEEQEKTINVTKNGTTEILPDDGKVLSKVTVKVDVVGDDTFLFDLIEQNLTEVVIPRGITKIGKHLFRECYTLTKVSLPESVTTIEGGAFQGCTNLKTILIPESVTTIEGGAFAHCRALTTMPISKNMTEIDDYCFHSCTSLSEIVIPDHIKKIGIQAFLLCSGVKRLRFEGTEISAQPMSTLRSFALSNLEEIEVPQGFNGYGINLSDSTLLSREQFVSFFEKLADRTGLETYTLTIGAANLTKLTEEDIAIATNKNWTIA